MVQLSSSIADVRDITSDDFTAANQLVYSTAAGVVAQLTVDEQRIVGRKTGGNIAALTATEVRTILNVEDGADVTDSVNVNSSGAVMESDYDAQTILAATSDNTPAALTVAEQTLVGRITSGNIAALTATQVRTLINVENGADVTDTANVSSAGAVMLSTYTAADEVMVGSGSATTTQITLAASQILGKKSTGSATNLTAADVRTILQTTGYTSMWITPAELEPVPGYLPGPVPHKTVLANTEIITGWLFSPTVEQKLQATINMPDDWDLGTVKVKVYWTTTEAPSAGDVVRWGAAGVAVGNDDALNVAFGSEVTVDDAVITIGDLHVSAATSAITIGGTPALGDLLLLKISRKATAAEDTMDEEDAKLLGISMQYGLLATTPSAW